jgi:hypothetical protein
MVASIAILNKLLPKMLPMHNPGESINVVAEILVNNSGKEVTADKRTPPKKAPESFVVLSIQSM